MFRHLAAAAIAAAALLQGSLCAAQTPDPPETATERIQAAIDRGDTARALELYELEATGKERRPELLSRIVGLRARQLLSDTDLRVVVEACHVQVVSGTSSCLPTVRRIADDTEAEMATRLAAAAVLVEGRVRGADVTWEALLGVATDQKPLAAADALSRHPPRKALRPLMALATGANRDARYVATLALVRLHSSEALPVLRGVAADEDAGAARLIAHIGLAAAGDRASLKLVDDTLPLMKGRDLLEAGRALARLKDPRGLSILRSMTEGNHEMLRIEAAEALHQVEPDRAARLLRSASESGNPWVRASALDAAARLRITPTAAMRRAMLDSNSWVAVRAVQAVTSDVATQVAAASPKSAR
jgi:HEAT repeat protein